MREIFLADSRGPRRRSAPEAHPFPTRHGIRVTPLILAAEMYPELERLVLEAGSRIFLAFRVFDPQTRLRSAEALEKGLHNWADLIKHRIADGVIVRVLLTDFEPTIAHALHASSWSSFNGLRAILKELPDAQQENLEIIVSQHPGELGWGLRQLLRIPMGFYLRKLLREFTGQGADIEALLAVRPGLWRYAKMDGGELRFKRGPAPRMWPSTHHHKFAVIDDRVAILGGLDVDERRWETKRYQQTAAETWHDVSVKLEGPAAGDAAEHFRRLWNFELPRFREITKFWLEGSDRELVVDPLDEMPQPIGPAPEIEGAKGKGQVLRTNSRKSRNLFAIGPKPYVRELMQGHRRIIFAAKKTLYIEAQFFRSHRAAGWIIQAARRNPALEVIIVTPQAPEEVAFDGDAHNPAHQHGEYLQAKCLDRLQRHLKHRVGFFALGRKAKLDAEEKALVAEEDTAGTAAFGSGMIYVHSKLLIADGESALVSSANMNKRSFGWDSEFGLLWSDPEGIEAFRQKLWGQLLERPPEQVPPLGAALPVWREQALANAGLPPEQRKGFILPFRLGKVRRRGRPSWFVPDDLV